VLPALFLRFLERWARGRLPYAYQDGVMDEGAARAIVAADDPVLALCASRALWGTLAGNAALLDALRTALARVDAWLAQRRPRRRGRGRPRQHASTRAFGRTCVGMHACVRLK
jgi:D-arabinitol 4-dehydrogenase